MSGSDSQSGGPRTEQEFREDLISLIRAAYANGVDVEGGWADRNPREDIPDWGIEIYEVVKPAGTTD